MGKTTMGYRGIGSLDLMEEPLRFLHKQHEDVLQADLFSALINGFPSPYPLQFSGHGYKVLCLQLGHAYPA